MGIEFDWATDEDNQPRRSRLPGPKGTRLLALLVLLVTASVFLGIDGALQRAQDSLRMRVQAVLSAQVRAFLLGDGDLFLSTFPEDPGWRAAQLLPHHQALYNGKPTVVSVEQHGTDLWALLQWQQGEHEWQRVAFFREQSGGLKRVSSVVNYWGEREERAFPWGKLVTFERDAPWADEIGRFVADEVAAICDASCGDDVLPFSLTLAADDARTLAPQQVRLPSPHLLALDATGAPGTPFWTALRRELDDYLAPASVRFVLPDEIVERNEGDIYVELASRFSAAHPNIDVEIVNLAPWGGDLAAALPFVDGAAVVPSEALLARGMVADLTDYAATDATFDRGDFYEQIWQGAWWAERMWFMPLAASQRLLFYDRTAVQRVGLLPSEGWTWEEFNTLVAALAQDGAFDWTLVDGSQDLLFAYAFNHSNRCTGATAAPHAVNVYPASVAAAYTWYRERVQARIMPELGGLDTATREFRITNIIAPRHAAIWVDEPVNYEAHLLRQPLGIIPFPGHNELPGITPLEVHGAVISQFSAHPRAAWAWLKFLSYQNPRRQLRWVPARPSVAVATSYWTTLPDPLASLLRTSFLCTRPVRIGERSVFSWEALAAIAAGSTTPAAAARAPARVRWFLPESMLAEVMH